ncbi:helix-turn-helix domain-containing protein [Taibaiella chishuiensis]|uniref:HTH araC/xylS-type domain-containing protein n=1 Tax=Taibaiella chishuiensis TaxID=1434707 RepID=A0A2P8D072_9BACT|nr:helix-turn-helix domain-containing protein [Taibaiella chishuiensis]PSK90614.1 hypothetical protein B0I18_10724 [Taibaiella chishuiensis]
MKPPVRHTEFFSTAHYAAAYTFAAPPPALQDYVELVWQSRFDALDLERQPEVHEQLLAHLSSSLVFSEGQPFAVTSAGQTRSINSDALLVGQHSGPIQFHHLKDNKLTGIKLKPGTFYRLSGIPADALCNNIVSLQTLAPGLYQQLRTLSPTSALTQIFNNFHPQAHSFRYNAVKTAMQVYLAGMPENQHPERVAAQVHLTPRTLNRYFKEVLGIAPRKAFSIARLRKALGDRSARKASGQAFSFYDYGYTDHSHFYKDLATYGHLHSLQQS